MVEQLVKVIDPTLISKLLFWGCLAKQTEVLNPMGCILKGRLIEQSLMGWVCEASAGIARGMGVPMAMQSQQSLAKVGLVVFIALNVASNISEV